jgi:hypothetical protein
MTDFVDTAGLSLEQQAFLLSDDATNGLEERPEGLWAEPVAGPSIQGATSQPYTMNAYSATTFASIGYNYGFFPYVGGNSGFLIPVDGFWMVHWVAAMTDTQINAPDEYCLYVASTNWPQGFTAFVSGSQESTVIVGGQWQYLSACSIEYLYAGQTVGLYNGNGVNLVCAGGATMALDWLAA